MFKKLLKKSGVFTDKEIEPFYYKKRLLHFEGEKNK